MKRLLHFGFAPTAVWTLIIALVPLFGFTSYPGREHCSECKLQFGRRHFCRKY